jgi:subtilisin family serine protease
MKLALIILAILAAACSDEEIVKKTVKSTTPTTCHGKPTVIAVIDTGFGAGFKGEETAKLCKYGHHNFVSDSYSDKFNTVDPVPVDHHGHGTHIAGLIDKYARAKNINYCLVILEYFDPLNALNLNLLHTIQAINYAKNIHADFINYSGGGLEANKDEIIAVKSFLDAGGKFIAAAGNEHSDLAKVPYYPAMEDDRVIVVGNMDENGKRAISSNYGDRVNRWEVGSGGVKMYNVRMDGTSQAAAIATGKIVGDTKNFCK